VTAAARSLIAQLRQAGAILTCGDNGKVRFSAPKPLPATLLAEARNHRKAIAATLAADAMPVEIRDRPARSFAAGSRPTCLHTSGTICAAVSPWSGT
jgi:hypothetical protein